MRIVFMGTPDFAEKPLRAIVENGYEVVGVFCQPDRPVGRKQKLTACEAKVCAQELGIPVFQFEKISKQEGLDTLRSLKPDLCVTAAFGQILSRKNLEVPPLGTVNIHASILPKYRGAAPIQWAIINGEKQTGVTTMYTSRGVDEGDIIMCDTIDILPDETADELFDRLSELGAKTIIKTLKAIEDGSVTRTPQDHEKATHCSMIEKQDAKIDFSKTAQQVHDLVRGMNSWPIAFCELEGQVTKIYKTVIRPELSGKCGEVLFADPKNGLVIACGQGAVEAKIIQVPGGKAINASDYLRGHNITAGSFAK